MDLEDAGAILIEVFPDLAGRPNTEVARTFFEKHPDYWPYMSKTMEAFRLALAKRRPPDR